MPYATSKNRQTLDVKNLCSRKLYELLSRQDHHDLSLQQRLNVEQELLARRHYLNELGRLSEAGGSRV